MVNFNTVLSSVKLVSILSVYSFKRDINLKSFVFCLVFVLFNTAFSFSVQSESLNKQLIKTDAIADSQSDSRYADNRHADNRHADNRHEVVFIDSAVEDQPSLTRSIHPDTKIIYLQPDRDGIAQIARALSTEQQVDAIHIISHGQSGELMLGSGRLNVNSLVKYRTEMQIIRKAMSQNGDILLYGCDVAQGATGEAFIASLASATTADVLASSNKTGSSIRGGDWILENRTGETETKMLFSESTLANYTGLLAAFNESFDTDPTGGAPIVSFARTLDSVQFDFTFTANGNGGDIIYETSFGDGNSASINVRSTVPDNGTEERITIVRNDSQDFTFTSIFINNTAGTTITVGGYNNNILVGSTQTVATLASATLSFGGIGVDEVRITSNDFLNTNIDTFVGDSVPPNTSPVISLDSANLAYSENAAVTQVDSTATLSDADGDADWNGGTLVAQITASNEAADELSIADNIVSTINSSGTNLLNGATTIGTLSASEGTVTNGTALTITFNSNATNALVQQVLRAIHYRNTSDTPGISNRTVTFTATDTNAASANDARTIAVSATNDLPTTTSLNGDSFTFTEGDAATAIDQSANATLADLDSTDFNTGNLTVTITSGEDAGEDVLSFDTSGTVALAGSTAGSNVSESGTVVGTLGNNIAAGNDLVVNFDANATPARVQALLRAITYQNTDTALPTTGARNIRTTINDGDGGISANADVIVTVVGQNDVPTTALLNGDSFTFTEGDAATAIDQSGNAILADLDSTDFNTGNLTVTITSGEDAAEDVLSFDTSGTVALAGTTASSNVSESGTVVGTLGNNIAAGNDLVVNFDANATPARVQALLRAITYQNTDTSAPTTGARNIRTTVNDGDGGTSANADVTVTVAGQNDVPTTILLNGDSFTFTEGGAATAIDQSANATLADLDSTDFNTGNLTVTITSGEDAAEDVLSFDTSGTVALAGTTASSNVSVSGTVIGTLNNNIVAGNDLVVNFDANATPARVQVLLRAITYQNTDTSAPTTGARNIRTTVNDGDGGTSTNADVIVTVAGQNDVPTTALLSGDSFTFTEGDAATAIDQSANATLADLDSTDFNTGNLTVTITSGEDAAEDVLSFDTSGTVALAGTTASSNVSVSGTVIGTLGNNIAAGNDLVVNFDANATPARVQVLLRAITYQNTDTATPTIGARNIRTTVNDGDGGSSANADVIVTVAGQNDLPTGSVTISGSATQNQTLTASNTLADTDGLGTISYQWQRGGANISGATATTYVLVQADVGNTITVTASYTDGGSTAESVASSATASVANANDVPTGSVIISGNATENQTLTASNTLADVDGLGTISYQWARGGSNISGATATTYVLVQADVGNTITVTASYTDGFSFAESVTSSATALVANVNSSPTGSVTITGNATQNQTLTASNTLADVDGLGTISYQWQRGGSNISGAIATTYVLVQADVGSTITVTASYTDVGSTAESVTSSATASVANVNDLPTGNVAITGSATKNQTLTASNMLVDVDGLGTISYQWKRGGSNISGATATTYVLVQADVGNTITVTASYTDGFSFAESVTSSATALVTDVNSSPTGSVTITGSAIQNQTLSASNTLADTDGLGTISYQWKRGGGNISAATATTYVLVQADVGSTITVTASYTDGGSTAESVTSSATASVTNVNDSPTGSVAISGSATQNQTLTASNTLADVDGLGIISYQWKRGGSNISAATATTYVLVQADVGSTITVTASYTDGESTAESVTSSATASVANINDSPTGSVSISGSATQNQTLTASNTLADVDGLGTISYQWKRGGSNISGATTTTYTLVQVDVGSAITVTASYTDGGSTAESVTSSATASVANLNDSPTGSVTISGSAAQGQTLIASNTLVDADGLGTISYQWKRGGSNISGATALTYVLVPADVGSAITVTASYTDGESTAESVTSTATAIVVAGNSAPSISGTPVTSLGDKTAYNFVPVASDPDSGDTLTFSITNRPAWAVFSTVNGSLSGTPGVASVGTSSNIVISVDDGNGQSASLSAFNLTVFADLDGDDIADSTDTDIDGDGMDNGFETANGLDPRDAGDAALDTDGDGLTNLEEFQAGNDPTTDDVPPQVTPPGDITLNATGFFTPVNTGAATAVDVLDGTLTATDNASSQLRPGITTVTWLATDAAGNIGTATQAVNIVPQVNISNSQKVAEGSSVNFSVILNGDALQYPVVVPYTVSGTAATDGSDHTLVDGSVSIIAPVAGELPEANVSFTVVDDGAGEGIETIVITLGTPANAVSGATIVHSIQLIEGNVAPFVALVASQGGSNTLQVDSASGVVTVSANVTDPNAGDSHSYDWSSTDNALIDTDVVDSRFTIDPTALAPGFYNVHVLVSDGSENSTSVLTLNILATLPVLDTTDSDGDGADDISEGFTDEDNDGVADYLDAIMAGNVLQEKAAVSNQFLMEADPGLSLSLGAVALRVSQGRSSVTETEVANFSDVGNVSLDTVTNVGGIFDFAVSGLLTDGQSVQIVIPQIAAIPVNPVYRKLMSTGWQDFVEDNNNRLASAAGTEGFCPPPGDATYQSGLNEGYWCVQITIEDGGPNDTDGIVDNRIADPGGVGTVSVSGVSLKSSGGTLSLWFLFILLTLLFLRSTKQVVEKTA